MSNIFLRFGLTALLFLGLTSLTLTNLRAEAAASDQGQPATILVKTTGLAASQKTTPLGKRLNIEAVTVPRGMNTETFRRELLKKPRVVWAEVDRPIHIATTTPNDPRYGDQWGLAKLNAGSAWDAGRGVASVQIAVIDTGIDGTHVDLAGRVGAGFNFVSSATIPAGADSDDYGHGTSVAGVIGASTNNNVGVAGVDWLAELVPLKAVDETGYADVFNVAAAIVYAADQGVKVINMSLGTSTDFQTIREAVAYAVNHGVIIVAAAGNDLGQPVLYPAAYPGVVAVGSSDLTDGVSDFSNIGTNLDVVAPGEDILSTNRGGGYSATDGTSLATPFVAGIAGVMLSRHPGLSPTQFETAIRATADKPSGMKGQNFTPSYGYGRANAARAIAEFSDYRSAWVSQNAYPTLTDGQAYQFEIRLQNIGATTWDQAVVKLGTSHPLDRVPVFTPSGETPTGWLSTNRIQMIESQRAPGETATFRFWQTTPAGLAAGTYREYFQAVAESITWMNDQGVFWDIRVPTLAERYQSTWVSQNAYPTLIAGQSYQFEVQIRNTGSITWDQATVHLGTSHAQDRIPVFARTGGTPSGWVATNRVQLVETSVAPNGIGTFRFWYTVPTGITPGTYREYFQPVADGITWLENQGIFWNITVLPTADGYHGSWVSQNPYPTLLVGQSYQFEVQIRNTGIATWTQGQVNLGTSRPQDRLPTFNRSDDVTSQPSGWVSPNRVELADATVAPTAIGTFRFWYTVPAGTPAGTYREYFQPVAEGVTWLEDQGIFWDITAVGL